MKVLEFSPTSEQILKARKISESFALNSRSFMGGKRNLYAFLAEVVVGDFLEESGWMKPDGFSINYDIVSPNGKKWDIKNKMTTVKPRANYNCTIYNYFDQKCDGYIFTRTKKDLSKVWILGWINKSDLLERGLEFEAGHVDDNMVMERGGIGIKIRELNECNYTKSKGS